MRHLELWKISAGIFNIKMKCHTHSAGTFHPGYFYPAYIVLWLKYSHCDITMQWLNMNLPDINKLVFVCAVWTRGKGRRRVTEVWNGHLKVICKVTAHWHQSIYHFLYWCDIYFSAYWHIADMFALGSSFPQITLIFLMVC